MLMMPRNSLNKQHNKPSNKPSSKQQSNRPNKDLTADNNTPKIHILLLLLFSRTQQPTLLRLIQPP
ncbi:hypothetical protein HanIR_Chr10g0475731 [Helianthus annuus]|nr:hypothetical protein HanIR_Chr10g0475731 [Helianthus annuus]